MREFLAGGAAKNFFAAVLPRTVARPPAMRTVRSVSATRSAAKGEDPMVGPQAVIFAL